MNEIPEKLNTESSLEQEIQALTVEIEKRRHLLDEEKGVMIESVGKDEVIQALSTSGLGEVNRRTENNQTALVNEDEDKTRVDSLVSLFRERGIKQALSEAKKQSPYVLDLFHDLLVNELYQELQKRGIVK